MEDFPTVRIELGYFLERVGELRPRQYSVAGGRGGMVRVLVRLVEKDITKYRRVRGLISEELLERSKVGDVKRGYITHGKLKYQPNKKHILVGIGTGVAPFFTLLQSLPPNPPPPSPPTCILYFGNQTHS